MHVCLGCRSRSTFDPEVWAELGLPSDVRLRITGSFRILMEALNDIISSGMTTLFLGKGLIVWIS